MKHNLFLIDDHSMLRKGISAYLEEKTYWLITGSFTDSKACIEELQRLKKSNNPQEPFPEIAIIDIQLGKESGFDLVSHIKSEFPQVKIVIYSMFDTTGFVLEAKD